MCCVALATLRPLPSSSTGESSVICCMPSSCHLVPEHGLQACIIVALSKPLMVILQYSFDMLSLQCSPSIHRCQIVSHACRGDLSICLCPSRLHLNRKATTNAVLHTHMPYTTALCGLDFPKLPMIHQVCVVRHAP